MMRMQRCLRRRWGSFSPGDLAGMRGGQGIEVPCRSHLSHLRGARVGREMWNRRGCHADMTALSRARGTSMRFRASIQLSGKTATGIRVPEEVVEHLGAGKRPAVHVTINGFTYRSTVASMGGEFMLPVSAEVRESAGVAAGDEVDVEIALDSEPREVSVPSDFAAALDADAEARRFFDGLSYSNRRRFVLSVEDAKTPETRQRRIAKAVDTLREGRV